MTVLTPVNPWSWSEGFGYEQANLVEGATRTLLCAGQTSVDADGTPGPRRRHGQAAGPGPRQPGGRAGRGGDVARRRRPAELLHHRPRRVLRRLRGRRDEASAPPALAPPARSWRSRGSPCPASWSSWRRRRTAEVRVPCAGGGLCQTAPVKYVVCVPDGCADLPVAALDGRTPLEVASMPTLAALAARGEVGRAAVIPPGMPPGSDVGNMSILGYDPARFHTGRAPIEAAALGLRLPPDQRRVPLQPRRPSSDDGTMVDFAGGHPSAPRRPPRSSRRSTRELGRAPAPTSSSTPACSTATSSSRPADWAEADCTPPHDLSDKPAVWPTGPAAAEAAGGDGRQPRDRRRLRPARPTRCGCGARASSRRCRRFADADRLPGRARHRRRPHPGPRRAHRHRAGRGARAPPAGSTPTTRASATPRLRSLDAGADLFLIHVEATDEAGHAGNLDEKVKALEAWDRRILADLVDGPRRHGPVADAAAARPPHARRAEDAHHRLGALPAGRLGGRRPGRHLHRAGHRRLRRRARPRAHGSPRRVAPRAARTSGATPRSAAPRPRM